MLISIGSMSRYGGVPYHLKYEILFFFKTCRNNYCDLTQGIQYLLKTLWIKNTHWMNPKDVCIFLLKPLFLKKMVYAT